MIGPQQLGVADILLDLSQVLYFLNRLDNNLSLMPKLQNFLDFITETNI